MSSATTELTDGERQFLEPFLPAAAEQLPRGQPSSRPYVTVTYACSLDGMISLAPGVRTTLSGPETKSVTHYLRLRHDAILVGVGTAIADSPSLNCRYPGVTLEQQPRPIVVDPKLRWQAKSSPVVELSSQGRGKMPWVVHGANVQPPVETPIKHIGLDVQDGNIDWPQILGALKSEGVESIMIEGGATILNTLLTRPGLVDSVIVTIAPTWLGPGGVQVSPPGSAQEERQQNAANLTDTAWKQFGQDVVLCGRLKP